MWTVASSQLPIFVAQPSKPVSNCLLHYNLVLGVLGWYSCFVLHNISSLLYAGSSSLIGSIQEDNNSVFNEILVQNMSFHCTANKGHDFPDCVVLRNCVDYASLILSFLFLHNYWLLCVLFSSFTTQFNCIVGLTCKVPNLPQIRGISTGHRVFCSVSQHFEGLVSNKKPLSSWKRKLLSSPVLILPDLHLPFEIMANAWHYLIGPVLTQCGHPFAYHSETFSDVVPKCLTYDTTLCYCSNI